MVSGGSDNIVQYLTDTFYTVTDLTPQTLYSISVYAICGVGDTSFATTTSVRTTCLPIQTLPYTQNFDAVTTSTTAATGVQVPCWDYIMTGSATYQTGNYLPQVYYSTTYANSGSYSYRLYGVGYHMLPPMPVDLSQLQLKFADYTTSASYGLEVGVMEGTTFVPIQTINTPASTHVTHTVYFNNYTGTSRVIAFRNYYTTSTSTYYSYHYLDDIEVDNIPACPDIVSHSVTTTASAARITWNYDANFGVTPDEYTVSYSLLSDSLAGATTTTVTDPIVILTGLTPDSAYMVSIMTTCTDGDGRAHIFTFNTQTLPCLEWDTTATGGSSSPTATYVVGTPGTSTTNVMPVNGAYNYSYCNHLILRSDIPTVPQGTTYFSGIDFQYAGTTPMVSKTNCAIYMCHTTMTVCDNFANPADLVLVYEGPLNCTTTGWNHFEFNRGTFAYNGTSNIIVAIVDNSGAHNSGETFYYENIGTSRSHRVYRDNAPYTFAELGTVTAGNSVWRSNMHLTTGGTGGGTCITTASCAAPALEVGQDANGDILLTWLPGYQEGDWDVDYRTVSETTWTSLLTATTLNQYTVSLSDLLPNTQYEYRVTANCSDTNISTTEEYTTPCSFFDVPFTESFDTWSTTAADPLPNCWEKHTNYTTNYPNASTSYAHTGTKAMYMYSTSSTYSYMVLPQFNVAIDSTVVSFWLYKTNTSYSHNLLVGVMTDPADFSTFEQVASVAPTALSTWEPFEIALNTYTGTGRYIAIVSPNNVYSYPYLDDLRIDRISDCPRVTNVTASNITQTDATISWTATNAAEYEVQYAPSGFNFGMGTIETNITADSIDLTGLASNTAYDVYVRGVCTDDTSNWSFVYTFRTSCGQISILPFTEDFETHPTGSSSTGNAFIPCWTRINNGTSYGGYPYVSSSSSYNHTQGGTKGLYWYNTTTIGTYGDYQYIVLPELDTLANPVNTLQLSFWAKSSSTSYSPVFQVGVKSSITDTAMTVVGTVNVGNSTVWTEYITSFAGYTGNGGYIAIRALRPTSSWYAYVDDITLELLPACPRIEDLHAINATLDSITIVWTDTSSTNTSWVVEYDTVDFTPGDGTVTPIIVTDTVYSLSGLDSATSYHIYVYPECDDYVGFRHITAATLAASPATVPYTCGFEENGPNGWDLLNDGQTNYWMVGNSTNNGGTQSLYITNNGIANAYTTSAISYSYAIRTFNFSQAGEYAYTYDWKCQGESHNYDFARIFVTPASEMFTAGDVLGGSTYSFATAAAPTNWIELTQSGATPNTLSQSSTWQTVIGTFAITNPGNYKFVIVWANDGSGGTNPPIAIDNVALQMNECPMVQNVSVALSADNININWMAGGDENEWV